MQTTLVEYDIKNTDILVKWLFEQRDEISIAILMYLATEEVLPVYVLEDFFTMYNIDEKGFQDTLNKLEVGGLINSYVGNVTLNGTTIISLTPLGREVGDVLKREEISNGYPITIKIFSKIIGKRISIKNRRVDIEKRKNMIEGYLLTLT